MAITYVAIATVTVTSSSGASSIDFTSIPQSYTDLLILLSSRSTRSATGDSVLYTLNGSSSSRSFIALEGRPNTNDFGTYKDTTALVFGVTGAANTTASAFSSGSLYLPNYTNSNNKSGSADISQEANTSTGYQSIYNNTWANSSAITSISLVYGTGPNFAQYSTATLYGIKNS